MTARSDGGRGRRRGIAVVAAISALVAAWAAPAAAQSGAWRLVDGPAALAGLEATVEWRDGAVFGAAPCNRFSGEVRAFVERIRILGIAATRRACAPEVMAGERAFFDALREARRFQIRDGALTLFDPLRQPSLRFRRAGARP